MVPGIPRNLLWVRKSGATLIENENSKCTTYINKATAEYEGYIFA